MYIELASLPLGGSRVVATAGPPKEKCVKCFTRETYINIINRIPTSET